MSVHTWFYKDLELYREYISLPENVDEEYEMDLYNSLDTQYHDIFRLNSCILQDTILTSREETIKFLEDNKKLLDIYEYTLFKINKFWNEFPNGVIDFG